MRWVMKLWHWIVGLGVVAVPAFALASGGKGSGPSGPADDAGLRELLRVCSEMGVSRDWALFLAVVAHHESRWNRLVGRGILAGAPTGVKINISEGEAVAAKRAFDRNADLFRDCNHSSARYTFGSGGWFGILPANGLFAFKGTRFQCMNPWAVFEPRESIAMAIGMIQRLMRYDGFKADPTWKNLNRGFAAPSYMGNPREGTDDRFEEALAAVARETGERPSGRPTTLTATPVQYLLYGEGSA